MTDYFTLTNLIRLLVVGSLAWWLLVDVPRWWRKRQAAKDEWAAKVPKTPKLKLPRKRAEEPAEPAAADEPVIARRRTLGTIAAEHAVSESDTPMVDREVDPGEGGGPVVSQGIGRAA